MGLHSDMYLANDVLLLYHTLTTFNQFNNLTPYLFAYMFLCKNTVAISVEKSSVESLKISFFGEWVPELAERKKKLRKEKWELFVGYL